MEHFGDGDSKGSGLSRTLKLSAVEAFRFGWLMVDGFAAYQFLLSREMFFWVASCNSGLLFIEGDVFLVASVVFRTCDRG